MSRIELTPRLIKGLKFPPPHVLKSNDVKWVAAAWDSEEPGLHVRVYHNGAKSFGVKYSVSGKQRTRIIGPANPGLLKEARLRAAQIKTAAKSGQDLVAEKRRKANRQTIAQLLPDYLADLQARIKAGDMRQSSYVEIERYLLGTERTPAAWKALHDRYPDDVEGHEVAAILNKIAKTHRNAADKARIALSGFWKWAKHVPDVDQGVMVGLPSYSNGSRERFLSAEELKAVTKALLPGDPFSDVVKLLMLTGARKTEIGDLQRSEIVNGDVGQIELPSERVKNGKAFILPLTPQAWEIVSAALADTSDGRPFLFGRYGSSGFSGWSKGKSDLDKRITRKMEPWTLHDLRRSFSTHMNEQGLAEPHIVEACLNHITGGVAGRYNKATYLKPKRAAFEAWGRWIAENVAV